MGLGPSRFNERVRDAAVAVRLCDWYTSEMRGADPE
jgi:hypothetical protein